MRDRQRDNKNARNWRLRNPMGAKNTYLKYKYGITLEQYEALLHEQGGVCGICKRPESVGGRNLCVDHNHKTGEVRGLLCLDCNSGVGHLKDNVEFLLEAIRYLSKYN